MRTLLFVALIVGLAACGPSHPTPAPTPAQGSGAGGSSNTPGAPTARQAVDQFFGAVHAEDLQAMSRVWGTAKGPARDNMDRAELEKREILLQCYFNHDSYAVTNESSGTDGRRIFRVQLTRGNQTRTPAVYTIQGPGGRWYVENLDMAAVRDFCAEASSRR